MLQAFLLSTGCKLGSVRESGIHFLLSACLQDSSLEALWENDPGEGLLGVQGVPALAPQLFVSGVVSRVAEEAFDQGSGLVQLPLLLHLSFKVKELLAAADKVCSQVSRSGNSGAGTGAGAGSGAPTHEPQPPSAASSSSMSGRDYLGHCCQRSQAGLHASLHCLPGATGQGRLPAGSELAELCRCLCGT